MGVETLAIKGAAIKGVVKMVKGVAKAVKWATKVVEGDVWMDVS
jgi:hypothetical protein